MKSFLAFKLSEVVYIMLFNIKIKGQQLLAF